MARTSNGKQSQPHKPANTAAPQQLQQLQELKQILQASLEATGDGILVVDQAGRILLSNQKFAQMWRVPESMIRDRDDIKLREFVMSQLVDPEAYMEKIRLLYGKREESTDIIVFKDGRVFERYSAPLLILDKFVGRVWSFQDMTAYREAQRLALFEGTFEMLCRYATMGRAVFTAMQERTDDSRKGALQAIGDFESHWYERDLLLTCSPSIIGIAAKLRSQMEKLSPELRAKRAKKLQDAEREAIIREAFMPWEPPADLGEAFLLPEHWRFHIDLTRDGREKGWHAADFDDSRWPQLSSYNFYEYQGFPGYDGAFWCRTAFKAPQLPEDTSVVLRIGSLDDGGDVYLNGELAFRRLHTKPQAWKQSFEVDVTKLIKSGADNTIAIAGNDAYGMGGLWRPCLLYARPEGD